MDNHEAEQRMALNSEVLKAHANRYYTWNLSLFPIAPNSRILDIGCGFGLYFNPLMQLKPAQYTATDYSDSIVNFMKELMSKYPQCAVKKVDILAQSLPQEITKEKMDEVLCFDVLEHLENDELALQNLYHLVAATGAQHLFLRVPALQWIYGKNDEAIGHFRRYQRKQLRQLLEKTGFTVEKIHYQNFLGILPWLIIGKIRKRAMAVSNNEGKFFDALVPLLQKIEAIFHPPLGLSLYAIATINKAENTN